MMNRRHFLRASSLVTAGVIAAGQLEILDRLAPRSLFAGWTPQRWDLRAITEAPRPAIAITQADLDALVERCWRESVRFPLVQHDFFFRKNAGLA